MTLPASGQKWLDTLETMRATISELSAERDRYRDALVARHGGEPLALLSELDAARAERDAERERGNGLAADLAACVVTRDRALSESDALQGIIRDAESESGLSVMFQDDEHEYPTLPDHIRSIVQERDAARRDLESLMAAAKSLTDDPNACWEDFLAAVDAIAAAEQGGA